MKKVVLFSTAFLFSAAVVAQTDPKVQHGTEVSATAKTTTNIDGKGASVSSVASAKSQASFNSDDRQAAKEARKARKADREEALADMKAEHREVKREIEGVVSSTIKTGADNLIDLKNEGRAKVHADASESAALLGGVKADLKSKKEIRKAARKEKDLELPTRARVKTNAAGDLKVGRPSIKAGLGAGARLGL